MTRFARTELQIFDDSKAMNWKGSGKRPFNCY